MAVCAENLSQSDMRMILSIDEEDHNGRRSAVEQRWRQWNRSLWADLAILRAQQQGRNIDQFQRIERVIGTEELAREAFHSDSPLAAEETLERGRWTFLDELEVGHYFDVEKLIVYRLKIAILERRSTFDTDKGLANFRRIYDTVTEEKIGVQPE